MKITKVAFFAYGVTDMKKARAFYEGFLGLKSGTEFPAKDDAGFVEYDLPDGNSLAIGISEEWPPSPIGACIAFEVDELTPWVAKIKEQNIPIKTGPHDFPSCGMISVRDPDGNQVCLHQKK